MNQTTNPA